MWQPDDDLVRGVQDFLKISHHRNVENIDTSIVYVTVKKLAEMAGCSPGVVQYAMRKGRLKAVRRMRGASGVLLHPEECRRWLLARGEEQEKKSAKAA